MDPNNQNSQYSQDINDAFNPFYNHYPSSNFDLNMQYPSQNFGTSQMPFSQQFSQPLPIPRQFSQPIPIPQQSEPQRTFGRGRGKQRSISQSIPWTAAEDRALVSAFMSVSTDPIVGTNQRVISLWKKVEAAYKENIECDPHLHNDRNDEALRARWGRIRGFLSKWKGCYAEARKMATSGQSENDIISTAHSLYEGDFGSKFQFGELWNMLRVYPNWELILENPRASQERRSSTPSGSSEKRIRPDDDIVDMTTPSPPPPTDVDLSSNDMSFEQTSPARPIGVKKAKNNGKNVSTLSADAKLFEKTSKQLIQSFENAEDRVPAAVVYKCNHQILLSYLNRPKESLDEKEKRNFAKLMKEFGLEA